jgi:hypothetical protein
MSGLGNRMSAGPGPGRLHIQYLTEQNCPGYLYQPESGAEPVKKGGVLFRAGTNPTDTGALKGGVESKMGLSF